MELLGAARNPAVEGQSGSAASAKCGEYAFKPGSKSRIVPSLFKWTISLIPNDEQGSKTRRSLSGALLRPAMPQYCTESLENYSAAGPRLSNQK